MNKRKIDKLVLASYSDFFLNQENVNKISALLSKSDLKKYINGLKSTEKKNSLVVSSPINSQDLKKIERLFPNKRILFEEDPTLMLGMKIVDNDIVYEFTFKNSLDRMLNYIEQNYD